MKKENCLRSGLAGERKGHQDCLVHSNLELAHDELTATPGLSAVWRQKKQQYHTVLG